MQTHTSHTYRHRDTHSHIPYTQTQIQIHIYTDTYHIQTQTHTTYIHTIYTQTHIADTYIRHTHTHTPLNRNIHLGKCMSAGSNPALEGQSSLGAHFSASCTFHTQIEYAFHSILLANAVFSGPSPQSPVSLHWHPRSQRKQWTGLLWLQPQGGLQSGPCCLAFSGWKEGPGLPGTHPRALLWGQGF